MNIAGCLTDGFETGFVVDNCSGSDAAAITGLDDTQVELAGSPTGFSNGDNLCVDTSSYAAVTPSAETLTTATLDDTNLNESKAYYSRVQYSDGSVSSEFSEWSKFTTADKFVPEPGDPFGGGYFVGQMLGQGMTSGGGLDDSGSIYNIILCPKEQRGLFGQSRIKLQYSTYGSALSPDPSRSSTFGLPLSIALADKINQFPGTNQPQHFFTAADFVMNDNIGPNRGYYDSTNSIKLGIGDKNDWYMPSSQELTLCYWFFKPAATNNNTASSPGEVATAVPPLPAFTKTVPEMNPDPMFNSGGSESFATSIYWAVDYGDSPFNDRALNIRFSDGYPGLNTFTSGQHVRAIRRQPA